MAELPHVRKVKVCVSKFNPPLGGICRRARVTLGGSASPSTERTGTAASQEI
jgi:hypothetical protein